MVPMNWRDKLWDTLIDRNVFYTILFIPVVWFAVPVESRSEAFGILAGLAFTGGIAKTVQNTVKSVASIKATGGGGGGIEGQ